MVLVRLRSQGDALLKRGVVPWIIDEDAVVIQSVETLLPELTTPMSLSDFLDQYELWCGGREIDLYARPAASNISPGSDCYIKPRPPAHRRGPEGSRAPRVATVDVPDAAPPRAPTPRQPQSSQSAPASQAASREPSPGPGSRGRASPRDEERSAFDDFLERNHLAHLAVPFAGIGIRTLGQLCSHSAAQVAVVTGDRLVAFRTISAAHDEMRRLGLHIDWAERIRMLYAVYNPGKASQINNLLRAYQGEEEALWRSVREKYEPELAAAAALARSAAAASPGASRGGGGDPGMSPGRSTGGGGENTLHAASGLVRSVRSSEGEVVYCPACRHGFVHVPTASAAAHAEEASAAAKRELDRRQEASVANAELTEALQRMTERLADAQQVSQHYEGVCREQEQWIRMLEQRVADLSAAMGDAMLSPGRGPAMPAQEPLEGSSGPGASLLANQSGIAPSPDRSRSAAPQMDAAERARLRRRLVEFYLKYSPEKVELVDVVMRQWQGRENELERLLSVEPSVVRLNAAGGAAGASASRAR